MAEKTGYEIDLLPVGNGDRSGDAIAIRYGTSGNYKVLVYDGGSLESGQKLVDHIKKYYGTTFVDYVVNSHPDTDHSSGLSVVLEQLDVGELWMHQPWNYSSTILDYFKDGRITDKSLAERLKNKMAAAYKLELLAEEKNIPVYEPFTGARIGDFVVLSPDSEWYIHELIADFAKSPDKNTGEGRALLGFRDFMAKSVMEAARKAIDWVAEKWDKESLREDVSTSAENESSVILYGNIDGRGILMTGDAGVRALAATADIAEYNNISLPDILKFIQVPHHGSRNNVSTSVLDRIVGVRKVTNDGKTTKSVFVSAGEESKTHPRNMVVNAFTRRGAKVFVTKGQAKRHHHNMPEREGWTTATTLPFYEQVESWE